jgi:hypothetical protein
MQVRFGTEGRAELCRHRILEHIVSKHAMKQHSHGRMVCEHEPLS